MRDGVETRLLPGASVRVRHAATEYGGGGTNTEVVPGGGVPGGVPGGDPQQWSAHEVQQFFAQAEQGRLRPFARAFSMVDGALLCSLSPENLRELLPGAHGLVVEAALRTLKQGDRRRSASSATRVDVVEHTFSEDKTFPRILIVPSSAAIVVGCVFLLTAALLATVFRGDVASVLMCSAETTTTTIARPAAISCPTQVLKYASIPVVSCLFTYCHIWLALWMTFFPIRYVGCCQLPHDDKTVLARVFGNMGLGWQGIIPFKAAKMARKATQLMTAKLLNVKQVFARIDPARVAEEIEPALHNLLGPIVDAVGRERAPTAWDVMPYSIKEQIVTRAEADCPEVIARIMAEIKDNIEEVFDLEEMVVSTFVRDKSLLIEMFIKCGRSEIAVIRDFGGWMGFAFGAMQMVVFHFMPTSPWMLPVFGGVVGSLTNWVALLMIFKPTWPVRIPCCCCGTLTLQGLFLKRQRQVAEGYARMTTRDVISTRAMLRELLRGPSSDRLFEIAHKHVIQAIDVQAGRMGRGAAQMLLGSDEYEDIKRAVGDKVVGSIEEMLGHAEGYFEQALDLERTLHVKMSALPPDEFEALLRPVFSEDEWKLIALGGFLGVVIGVAQVYILGA
jgi:uncharacterized membrane protein YheB (UPF0754 family)